MKKKWWILIILVLVLAITALVTSSLIKNWENKEYEDKVNYTINKYKAFINNEISNDSDAITGYFNKIITEKAKQEEINENKIVLDINNIDNTLNTIEEEIKKYDIKYLEEITNYDLDEAITNDVDKDTVLNIYQNDELIQNISEEEKKRSDYLKHLEEIKNTSKYLKDNSKYYEVKNNTIACKNKEIYNALEDLLKEYNWDYTLNLEIAKKEIPILCYHGVLDNPWGAATLFVKVEEFDKQMKYLNDNGYTPIFVSEIEDAGLYEKPIIITFDDGYSDVYNYAYPILQKYNFKSTFFVVSGFIGGDVYINQDMLKEMSNSGLIEIGSHTASHPKLNTLDKEGIEYEFKNSKEVLESIIKKDITTIAYPSGLYNQDVLDMAQKYYDYGVSTDWGKENSININKYRLKRLYVYREHDLEQFKYLL